MAAPLCAAPDPKPRRPRISLPANSCDSHAHICGPVADYDYADDRIYTPPDALLPQYRHMLGTLGVDRAVLVQPSVYGADNAVLMDALAKANAEEGENFRGVAVIDDDVSDDDLGRLHLTGIRGVRVNVVDVADPKAGLPVDQLRLLADRIAPLGWHLELLTHADEFPDLDVQFADFPVDLVFGHMGYLHIGHDTQSAGFQALLRLAAMGRCWVKLTGPYRISAGDLPYPDATPFARALIHAAPDQVIWGTDWPHVMVTKPMPNDGDLCDLLEDWIPDEDLRARILVDNPARLYGFA